MIYFFNLLSKVYLFLSRAFVVSSTVLMIPSNANPHLINDMFVPSQSVDK